MAAQARMLAVETNLQVYTYQILINSFIMEKKNLYVVTQTIVGLDALSVDTFVLGYSEELEGAKSILKYKYDKLCEMGYDQKLFKHEKWTWCYKSESVIIMAEIIPAQNH